MGRSRRSLVYKLCSIMNLFGTLLWLIFWCAFSPRRWGKEAAQVPLELWLSAKSEAWDLLPPGTACRGG